MNFRDLSGRPLRFVTCASLILKLLAIVAAVTTTPGDGADRALYGFLSLWTCQRSLSDCHGCSLYGPHLRLPCDPCR